MLARSLSTSVQTAAARLVGRISTAVLATAACLVPALAGATESPVGSAFDIWYYATDADGDRSRLFSSTDLTGFVNQARCQCNQTISTRIRLQRAMTTYTPSVRVQTFVGNRCADAQSTVNPQISPCLRVLSDAPNAYTKEINFEFSPVWLVAGVEPGGSQDLGQAEPAGSCDAGQGTAGVWICIENGEQPDCQSAEFEVTGTQNKNGTADMMGQGITYDFDPPQTLPENFAIDEGDGAVVIEWDQIATGDVAGFRVLCADAEGNPLPGKGIDPPSLTGINRGTIYFTAADLCPDGELNGPDEPIDSAGDGSDETGEDSGSTTGDDGTTTFGDLTLGTSDADTSGDGTSGTDTSTGTSTGSSTGAATGAQGLESMRWEYICSPHISGTAQEARITGLDNGVEYKFMVVAYDVAGNPIPASGELTATPRETIDLWEQCEIDGDICGSGGFCNCTTDGEDGEGSGWLLGGVVLAIVARRRRAR
jgi:MYXO-CTERM domain-containing protein